MPTSIFSIFEEIENSIMTEIEKQIEEMEKSLNWFLVQSVILIFLMLD